MYCGLKHDYGLRHFIKNNKETYLIIDKNHRDPGLQIEKDIYDFFRFKCDGHHFIVKYDEIFEKIGFIRYLYTSDYEIEEYEFEPWQISGDGIEYHPELEVAVTQRCNYNCIYCFETADDSPLYDAFSIEEFDKLMQEALYCGVTFISLTGGEPMVHKHFYDIIKSVDSKGLMISEIMTNGSLITDDFLNNISIINACRWTKFCISFDGVNGKHDKIRNCSSEKVVLENIKKCLNHGFDVKITYNLNKININELKETTKLFLEMGIKEFRIARTMPSRKMRILQEDAILSHKEWLDEAVSFTSWYMSLEDVSMKVDFWDACVIDPKMKCIFLSSIKSCGSKEIDNNRLMCPLTFNRVCICGDGMMVPCHQISGGIRKQDINLGNVKESGLKSIFEDSPWLDLVSTKVTERLKHLDTCSNCEYWEKCLGGCPYVGAPWRWEYGEKFPYSTDVTQCEFFKGNYISKFNEILRDYWCIFKPFRLGE